MHFNLGYLEERVKSALRGALSGLEQLLGAVSDTLLLQQDQEQEQEHCHKY